LQGVSFQAYVLMGTLMIFISKFSALSEFSEQLPTAADLVVTFQKFLLMVVLLKDQLKTKENRIVDFPFSYFSTIQS